SLRVLRSAAAPLAAPPAISVDGGGRRATARGTAGVSAGGVPARFAAAGRYALATRGARPGGGGCGRRRAAGPPVRPRRGRGTGNGPPEDTGAWALEPAPARCPSDPPNGTPPDQP